MIKKLFLTFAMLLSIVLSASAFEKASNSDAKKAKHIALCATGYRRENPQDIEDEVVIDILGFKGHKWAISIVTDDGRPLTGVFTFDSMTETEKLGHVITADGINSETGEDVRMVLSVDDNEVILVFYASTEDQIPDMQYNTFCVKNTNSQSFILLNKSEYNVPITDSGWKKATPTQLRTCLTQNLSR